MLEWIHPSLVLIVGALLLPFLEGRSRQIWQVALPGFVLLIILGLEPGQYGQLTLGTLELMPGRVDKLSLVFAYVFGLILVIGNIYALHVTDWIQHVAAMVYAAGALGVVFAGDLVTLYVFWELMVISSVWLIWQRQSGVSYQAGMRYLLVHAFGGMLLLAGLLAHYQSTGSIAFEAFEPEGWAFYLILVAFLINAAVPPLHAWLTDAYPEATVTGTVFLSALTTKTAVYTLVRGFPGTELLIWLGVVMALWGVVYAVLANDIRRLLAYHIVSQVGYMVAGVGMGTTLALSGTAAHAFTHILYKALLLMGAGAVLHMTGRSKLTELGGLYRWMPITFLLYMVGGLSISAFPLFSGFVSKTMIVEAAAVDYRAWVYLLLTMASAGTFLHTGLKLPYFTFLGKDSGLRPKEAPRNMLVAMGIAAAFCFLIGVFPGALYAILPNAVDYHAYTAGHLLKEMQLLLFTGLGFFLLLKHVGGEAKISVDTDWFYRRLGPLVVTRVRDAVVATDRAARREFLSAFHRAREAAIHARTSGRLAQSWPTGSMALWTALVLAAMVVFGVL
ncbi:Na(+)/H(+) antiporter subunit D [Sediminicurvatus halobius]|uniref:Na(+)/H(+) antiporter subunit D n=1 Tax=Sediminicurvatus halobius TaxID=2182432 RepID=A0A2U2N7J4_9GAMM|nr:Na(+)/H(+) antiporter subunit D [Spiribacter halobius]PWG65136.1 Na(+)/H(+) antiporter subunit D [Spiribacter halobius]